MLLQSLIDEKYKTDLNKKWILRYNERQVNLIILMGHIQRNMYSAFLIMNISDDLNSFDIDKCNERFESFYRLHNLEVHRLTSKKNLSSIAI